MDLVRIFRSIVVALLVVVFLALLVSAYSSYRVGLSTAKLADACSSIANHLALNELAYTAGGNTVEYAVDPSRLDQLPELVGVGQENYSFCVQISTLDGWSASHGDSVPPDTPVAALSLPVAVFDNTKLVPGVLEVQVWRA